MPDAVVEVPVLRVKELRRQDGATAAAQDEPERTE
jgi:hypothetical protein